MSLRAMVENYLMTAFLDKKFLISSTSKIRVFLSQVIIYNSKSSDFGMTYCAWQNSHFSTKINDIKSVS